MTLPLAWFIVKPFQSGMGSRLGRRLTILACAVLIVLTPAASAAAPVTPTAESPELSRWLVTQAQSWMESDRINSSLQMLTGMVLLGLVPAALLMTTSYVRVAVVLGLLRQAFGAPQLVPAQVTTSLALIVTGLVMWPTWREVYQQAVVPLQAESAEFDWEQSWQAGVEPIRQFMSRQIEASGNSDDVWLFLRYLPEVTPAPTRYDEVPLQALVPAFMLSELKTAFLIGFQIYLPFLVIDLVVSAVTASMGLLLMSPSMVALPLKLLLFVLTDGWRLVIGMLLESFQVVP